VETQVPNSGIDANKERRVNDIMEPPRDSSVRKRGDQVQVARLERSTKAWDNAEMRKETLAKTESQGKEERQREAGTDYVVAQRSIRAEVGLSKQDGKGTTSPVAMVAECVAQLGPGR
jgi:hypothetical protein